METSAIEADADALRAGQPLPDVPREEAFGQPKGLWVLAGTELCEAPHFQYHVSGILRIKMDDGTEFDCKPGEVSLLPSGHDAWVVGNEPAVVVDFQGMIDYARSR